MQKKAINDHGSAGTIIVVLIFSFLMTVSTAYIKMVQTEIEVQTMMDQSDRAMDAAFSGINYAISVAQTRKEMFENNADKARMRIYLVAPTTNWSSALNLTFNTTNFPNAARAGMLYLNEAMPLFNMNETATQAYAFKLHSYPGVNPPGGLANISPGSYTIKVQGFYRVFADNKTTVLATYSSQLIAQCEINFARKVVQLKRWRNMAFETDAAFYTATNY